MSSKSRLHTKGEKMTVLVSFFPQTSGEGGI